MFKQIELPDAGQRVGVVCGPGQFAEDNQGIVLAHVSDRFGAYCLVLMDSGACVTCHGLSSHADGIGWHVIK